MDCDSVDVVRVLSLTAKHFGRLERGTFKYKKCYVLVKVSDNLMTRNGTELQFL